MDKQSQDTSILKQEMNRSLLELKENIGSISNTVDDIPFTIEISSNQVKCVSSSKVGNFHNEKNTPIKSMGDLNLTDVINQHDKRSDQFEECFKQMEHTLQTHNIVVSKVEEYLEDDVENLQRSVQNLEQWKKDQCSVDLTGIQRSQNEIDLRLQSLQHDVLDKTTRTEVDSKLEKKFNEIVDHLQKALLSAEKDEADFKAVTESLSRMCQKLKANKADREDISSLRKQFIDNQIEFEMPSINKSPSIQADTSNEEIRRMLNNYPTKEFLNHELDEKADKNFILSRLHHTDLNLQNMRKYFDSIMSIIQPLLTLNKIDNSYLSDSQNEIEKFPLDGRRIASTSENLNDFDQSSQVTVVSINRSTKNEEVDLRIEPAHEDPRLQLPVNEHQSQRYKKEVEPAQLTVHMKKSESSNGIMQCKENKTRQMIKSQNEPLISTAKSNQRAEKNDFFKNKEEVFPAFLLAKKIATKRNSQPRMNRDKKKLNPCPNHEGVVQSFVPHQKISKEPLRALDQYQRPLPIFEKKKMVSGDDGKLYIASRNGNYDCNTGSNHED